MAFWIASPGRGELRTETLRTPGAGELRIETLYSGVSRGTESLVFGGHVPPGEYERMRAPFQAGHFPAPVKYGYANVGRVEEGPAERIFSEPRTEYTRALFAAAFNLETAGAGAVRE